MRCLRGVAIIGVKKDEEAVQAKTENGKCGPICTGWRQTLLLEYCRLNAVDEWEGEIWRTGANHVE